MQRVSKLSELNDLAGKPQQKPNDEKWFSLRHKLQADVVSRKTSEQPISAEKLPFSRTRNLNQLTFDVDIDLLLVASGVAIFIFFFFFSRAPNCPLDKFRQKFDFSKVSTYS